MKLPHRRQFLHLAAGAAALPAMPRFASALDYPSRPVRLLEGFGVAALVAPRPRPLWAMRCAADEWHPQRLALPM